MHLPQASDNRASNPFKLSASTCAHQHLWLSRKLHAACLRCAPQASALEGILQLNDFLEKVQRAAKRFLCRVSRCTSQLCRKLCKPRWEGVQVDRWRSCRARQLLELCLDPVVQVMLLSRAHHQQPVSRLGRQKDNRGDALERVLAETSSAQLDYFTEYQAAASMQ